MVNDFQFYKEKNEKNKEVTKTFERMPLGDKGLGRLSVQKLGNYMLMKTKKKAKPRNTQSTFLGDIFERIQL